MSFNPEINQLNTSVQEIVNECDECNFSSFEQITPLLVDTFAWATVVGYELPSRALLSEDPSILLAWSENQMKYSVLLTKLTETSKNKFDQTDTSLQTTIYASLGIIPNGHEPTKEEVYEASKRHIHQKNGSNNN